MSLARTALGVLATQVVSAPVVLATQIILARTLSVEARGVYGVATEFVFLATALAQLGWPTASIYRIRNQAAPPAEVASAALAVVGLTSLATLAVCVAFGDALVGGLLGGAPMLIFVLAASAIPFQILGQFFAGLARGLDRFDVHNAHLLGSVCFPLLALPIAFWFLGASAPVAVGVYLANQCVVGLGVFAYVARLTGLSRRRAGWDLRGTWAYGSKVYAHNVLANLHERMDVLLLAAFTGEAAVAIYAIAVAVVNRIRLVPAAIALSLFPTVAGMQAEEAGQLTGRVLGHSVLWVVVSILLLAPLSWWLVPLLFGAEYQDSVLPLLVLLPGAGFLTIHMILTRYFAARDMQRVSVRSQLLGVSLNLVANLFLIPRYGVLGAAIASLFSYTVQGLVSLLAFRFLSGVPAWRALVVRREDFALYRHHFDRLRGGGGI